MVALFMASLFFGSRYYAQRRQLHAYQQLAVSELQDARRVQMGLMPEVAPEIEGVEIAGKCLSANTVSGDFFDYLTPSAPHPQPPLLVGEGPGERSTEIAIVVADVTGKAMKGAMNAVMTDGILRMAAEEMEHLSPATLLIKLNNVLKARMEHGMNVTMVIGVIDVETKTLTLANAAHHAHPLLWRQGEVHPLKLGGLPLGMRAGIKYREETFPCKAGM